MPVTINVARDDLLSKLSIPDYTTADIQAVNDVLVAMNGAMQILQTAGEYFFTRQKSSVNFGAGTASLLLDTLIDVQTVIGPLRWNDTVPLRGLAGRSELDQFDRIYQGTSSFGASVGTPYAYFIENIRFGTAGDIVQSYLYLCPKPSVSGTVVIEYIPTAPSYTTADFTPGTLFLPIPQNYTESVFLPIARWLVTRSSYFSRPDIAAQLKDDYDSAIQHLVAVGGWPDPYEKSPLRKVDE